MSKQMKTAIPNLGMIDQHCPICGNLYTPVEYYTGTVVSSNSARVDYSTVQTQTTYRNVTQHTGGFCRCCDKERQRGAAKLWAVLGAIGLLMCLIGVLMLCGVIQYDTFKYGGLEIMLIAVGGLAFLSGVLVIICTALIDPKANINYATLYQHFIKRLQKEHGMQDGLAYFSAETARGLRRG